MGSRRAVKPAAGALLCLGTGYAAVSLGDPDSATRQRISKRASEVRTEVLLRALSKCLLPPGLSNGVGTAIARPPSTAAEPAGETDPIAIDPRFYVITGPDAYLTSLARERVAARAGLDSEGNTAAGGGADAAPYGGRDTTHADKNERPVVRLGVPYGCTLGSGDFSSLLEQQLLRQPHAALDDHDRGKGCASPAAEHGERGQDDTERGVDLGQDGFKQEQQRERSHSSTDWDAPVGEETDRNLNREQERESPPPASTRATTQTAPLEVISTWDSFLLWATSAVLHGAQLDSTALVALERVLAESNLPVAAGGANSSSPGHSSTATVDDSNANHGNIKESLQPASSDSLSISSNMVTNHGGSSCNFVLVIGRPARQEGEETERGKAAENAIAAEGRRADGSEAAVLCGDLARWGWKLASRRLATVVVSSSNPWVLAELQQALQRTDTDSEESSEEDSQQYQQDSSGEAVVVRVAIPSAAQRQQEVLSVAGELGLDGSRLSAADISAISELTGARHDALLAVLKRVKEDSPTAVTATLAQACHAAVDDQARDLAKVWGLLQLSREGDSSTPNDESTLTIEVGTNASETGLGAGAQSATGSMGPGEQRTSGAAAAAAAAAVALARRGEREKKSRKDWAPLWEAMGMLSVPSVAVGAVAAGATSAASTPFGTAHPAELLEECALDGVTLLRLTSEGWLELSPAAPQVSGTILEDTEPCSPSQQQNKHRRRLPSITVHTATVPIDSLSRGVDRSLVGAPPFRLAAFRRLVDGHRGRSPATTPPATSRGEQRAKGDKDQGLNDGRHRAAGSGGGNVEVEGDVSGGGRRSRGGEFVNDFNGAGAGAGELEQELNYGADVGHVLEAEAREAGTAHPGWSGSEGGAGVAFEGELERAGCLIQAAVLGRLHEREEAKLSEDGALLSSNWADLGTLHIPISTCPFVTPETLRARRDLEREGRGEDVSDGEWAEVQLELIRQERAVVARASEMQTRRGRLNSLRRDILGLEKCAGLLPSSPLPTTLSPPPSEDPRTFFSNSPEPTGVGASLRASMGDDNQGFSGFAEEVVLRNAETGVRLRPLRVMNEDGGNGRGRSAQESCAVESGVSCDGSHDGGKSRRGFGVRRLWRWVRGFT